MILAIDPGDAVSGVVLTGDDLRIIKAAVLPTSDLLTWLRTLTTEHPGLVVAVEHVSHYGTSFPAGRHVFDTCRVIGRVEQVCADAAITAHLVMRVTVKAHICGTPAANDSHVIRALVARFAPGQRNKGKGTKAEPGHFHGVSSHAWQAYALAVYVHDTMRARKRIACAS